VLLSGVNVELSVQDDMTLDDAGAMARSFRAALYSQGVTPCACPLVATHSVNDYAGISARDSEYRRRRLPEELKDGITSATDNVEIWPLEIQLGLRTSKEPPTRVAPLPLS